MKRFYSLTLAFATLCTSAYAMSPVVRSASEPLTRSNKMLSRSEARTVLASKKMKDNVYKQIVRDPQGRVYCEVLREGKPSAAPVKLSRLWKEAVEPSFYEDFESHQGQLDWLPDGWTEINTPENIATPEMCAHNINNTWATENTGDGYWTAQTPNGVKECWIHFTYNWSYTNSDGDKVEGSAAPQDEWLITPDINVRQNHDLFFLAEMDLGSMYAFDWSSMAYDHNAIDCDLEVLVTTDNGQTWNSVWKATEDVCSALTDSQMYDLMGELRYDAYSVSLAPYYGQTVKIAFRYLNASHGFSGNSMAVDAVTVSAPAPEAFYDLPDGALLAGISTGLHVFTESYGLFPAFSPITWTAASNSYTTASSWQFFATEEGDIEIVGNNAEVAFPNSDTAVAWPILNAFNANGSDVYQFGSADAEQGGMFFGGKMKDITDDETTYVGNYDYQHKHMNTPYLSYGNYVYGTSAAGTWGNGVKQTAFGNLFLAPSAPFTLNDVMVTLGEFDADADAELTLNIYPVNQYGQVSAEPAATSVVNASDIDGFGFYNVIFHLDTPYVMDSHTLMLVSGYGDNAKIRELASCAQAVHNDAAHNFAYIMFNINGQDYLYAASDALQDYSSAVIMGLNGAFHFIRCEEEIVDLDENDSRIVRFNASNTPDCWWVADGDNKYPIVSEGTDYDWLNIKPTVTSDGAKALLFTAVPSEIKRAKTVVIANDGGETRIRVRQQEKSSVGLIAQESSVSIIGNILSVNSSLADSQVEIFTPAGNLMMSGKTSLDITPLRGGIYIVKAGSKAFKIIL